MARDQWYTGVGTVCVRWSSTTITSATTAVSFLTPHYECTHCKSWPMISSNRNVDHTQCISVPTSVCRHCDRDPLVGCQICYVYNLPCMHAYTTHARTHARTRTLSHTHTAHAHTHTRTRTRTRTRTHTRTRTCTHTHIHTAAPMNVAMISYIAVSISI